MKRTRIQTTTPATGTPPSVRGATLAPREGTRPHPAGHRSERYTEPENPTIEPTKTVPCRAVTCGRRRRRDRTERDPRTVARDSRRRRRTARIAAPFVLGALVVLGPVAAAEPAPAGDETARRSIETVLETFARGESAQSVDILEPVLDPAFEMTAVMNGSVVTFSRDAFLQGIAAKRFGGNDNPLSIEHIDVDGETAAVEMRLEGSKVRFHHYATLASIEGSWRLVHSLVTMHAPHGAQNENP